MSAPVIHYLQNHCLRRFHDAGAVDAKSARPTAEMGIGESQVFRYLRFRGVIREAEPGRYYIDTEAEGGFRRKRFRFTFAVLCCGIAVIASLLVLFLLMR